MSSTTPAGSTTPGELTAPVPGEVRSPDRLLELSPGRARTRLEVTNSSSRQVRVSSHYPFWQVNRRLEFDRAKALGFRLDLPAGATIRWAPGETRDVGLVAVRDGDPGTARTGSEPAGGSA